MQPEEVQRLLQGEVSDAAVRQVLTALWADPTWVVLEPFRSGQEWVVQLV